MTETATVRRPVILGSSSIWRQTVLREAGIPFTAMSADIDEKAIRVSDPFRLTTDIALAKVRALLPRISEPSILITVDQVAVFRGQMREKPENPDQAREWLREYRGETVDVINGVVVMDTERGWTCYGNVVVESRRGNYSDAVIEAVIADGTVLHTCGAALYEQADIKPYIQCKVTFGGDPIEGEYEDAHSAMIGLPIVHTRACLRTLGWRQS